MRATTTDEPNDEILRGLTVRVLLELRREYLRTPAANVLKHWDQIQARLRAAARTSAGMEEWSTRMMRGLGIQSPGKGLARTLLALRLHVTERAVTREWLDLLEREYGLLIAMTRWHADEETAARKSK